MDFGLFLDITGIGVLFGGEEQLARRGGRRSGPPGLRRPRGCGRHDRRGVGGRAKCGMRSSECGVRKSQTVPAFSTLGLSTFDSATLCRSAAAPSAFPPKRSTSSPSSASRGSSELLALPRASLRARFGERLLLRIDQFTGAAQETDRRLIGRRRSSRPSGCWNIRPSGATSIEQIVHELVGRVAAGLGRAARRGRATALPAGLRHSGATPALRIEVGLFRPSADARHLWDLVRMQLEQIALPGPVGRVTLQARRPRRWKTARANSSPAARTKPTGNWPSSSTASPAAWAPMPSCARSSPPTRCRSGRREIECQDSELRSCRVRRGFRVRGSGLRIFALGTLQSACFRPLFLRPPLPLDVVSVVPDGPPITFRLQGQLHRVAAHWGPERIETGWWRGASVRRDYYRVQTEEGLRFWLFRRLDDGSGTCTASSISSRRFSRRVAKAQEGQAS